jgi:hypothetical protein
MVVTGVEVDLGSITLDPTRTLAVYADTIVMPNNGVLRMPSKAVCLSAREIICNGATVDTSGLKAVQSYPAGASAGSQGAAGAPYLGPDLSGGKGGPGAKGRDASPGLQQVRSLLLPR